MTNLKIITVPNPILSQKAKKVGHIDNSIKKIIDNMIDTLRAGSERVGLAAPQIGIPLKITVIEIKGGKLKDGKERQKIPLTILINPEITEVSKETKEEEEGCLSVPGVWGLVERPKSVTVRTLNERGKLTKIKASDLFARALQHEIDHLNGILFTSKADLETLHKITDEGAKIKITPTSL